MHKMNIEFLISDEDNSLSNNQFETVLDIHDSMNEWQQEYYIIYYSYKIEDEQV